MRSSAGVAALRIVDESAERVESVLMAVLLLKAAADITAEQVELAEEVSNERFDRIEFAISALELVRPPRTTVAICEDAVRIRVECGPIWGRKGEAWALLAIPRNASRRAIALAVAQLTGVPRAWAFDVLLGARAEGQ
jgi:hypothetical protein